MKPTWIIENYSKEPSFKELTAAVEELGYPLIKIDGDYKKEILLPFKNPVFGDSWRKQCVITNGTIKICKILKEELEGHCSPIIYSNFPKYKCSAYYSHYGPYLFNDRYCLITLSELNRQKYDIWGHYGKDALIFIRPDSGEKDFQAGLLDILDLSSFVDNNQDCLHDLMLVSSPKNIKWEGRFIVSKHKEIIAHSTYKFQDQITKIPSVPPKSLEFCKELLQIDYMPDSVFCLDICEDSDGNFWLMELTSFSSAGLYSSDKTAIVKRVSEIAWEDFNKQ